MNRHTTVRAPSPILSTSDDELVNVLEHTLSISHRPTRPAPSNTTALTPRELRREAEYRSRDATLRAREARALEREAEQLRRQADLIEREEAQATAERQFWESLDEAPSSDDDRQTTTSISSLHSTTSHYSSPPPTPATNVLRGRQIAQSRTPAQSPNSPLLRRRQRASSPSTESSLSASTASQQPGLPQANRRIPTMPINFPPPNPRTPAPGDTRSYRVTAPGVEEVVSTWASAGHLTLPNSAAKAKLVTPTQRRRRGPYRYHTIVKGTHPGVYEGHWDTLEHLVKGVPHANYKGFHDLEDATTAFFFASLLGIVVSIPARNETDLGAPAPFPSLVSTSPTQEEILHALSATSANFLGQTWYAVFKGVRPGIYPCWNFVSDLVTGISTATCRSFESREDAVAAFALAEENNEVYTLRGDRSYVVPAL
ncbi:hypothetical protein HWV62_32156 [Athelia sp. TMB]|nr:hypothetical protein HWV62_32156 [Athelia sp. TMB]